MAVIDLCTLEQVKSYLTVTSVNDDPLLNQLITGYSAYIQKWLNRELGLDTYVDRVNGNNGTTMLFRNYPVKDLTSLQVNDRVLTPSASAFAQGYVWDENSVSLRGDVFWNGKLNVIMTYTAGYTDDDLPTDLQNVTVELVALRYKEKDRIGLQSKGLAGETITYNIKAFPDSVRQILNNYRKVAPN
jgi:hypothetical protein